MTNETMTNEQTEKVEIVMDFSIGIPTADKEGNLITRTHQIEIPPLTVNVPKEALKSKEALEDWVKQEYHDGWDYAPDLSYINVADDSETGLRFPCGA